MSAAMPVRAFGYGEERAMSVTIGEVQVETQAPVPAAASGTVVPALGCSLTSVSGSLRNSVTWKPSGLIALSFSDIGNAE